MVFFEQRQASNSPSKFDQRAAAYLHKHLLKHRKLVSKAKLQTWAREFRLLSKEYDEHAIKETLVWYARALNKPYTPEVRSARSFRDKFQALQEAHAREAPAVKVSKQARKIVSYTEYIWPTPYTQKDERAAVQITIDALLDFRARLVTALDRHRRHRPSRLLLEAVEADTYSVGGFVGWWWEHVHQLSYSWPQWEGPLAKWALRYPHQKRFRDYIKECTQDFTAVRDGYAEVHRLVYENRKG